MIESTAAAATCATASFPYSCEVDVSFPSADHAKNAKKTLEVDEEIGDRVVKSFSLLKGSATEEWVVMRVHFRATEAKMLRVAVSTFYDYLTVVLKCLQEFEDRR